MAVYIVRYGIMAQSGVIWQCDIWYGLLSAPGAVHRPSITSVSVFWQFTKPVYVCEKECGNTTGVLLTSNNGCVTKYQCVLNTEHWTRLRSNTTNRINQFYSVTHTTLLYPLVWFYKSPRLMSVTSVRGHWLQGQEAVLWK